MSNEKPLRPPPPSSFPPPPLPPPSNIPPAAVRKGEDNVKCQLPAPPPLQSNELKPLHQITVLEVGILLDVNNMDNFRAIFQANRVNGAVLSRIKTIEELKSLGMTLTAKAKLFLSKLQIYRQTGVPLSILADDKRGMVDADEANAALMLHHANMTMKSKSREENDAGKVLMDATFKMKHMVREEAAASRELNKSNNAMKAMVLEEEEASKILHKSNEKMKHLVREEDEAGQAMLHATKLMKQQLKEKQEDDDAAAAMENATMIMKQLQKDTTQKRKV